MKFTPLKFQIPLAAGGISLMAFNYLQFAVPHGKGLVKFSDIVWSGLTPAQLGLYLPLIAIMLVFSGISLGSTAIYLRQLRRWLFNRAEYQDFITSPSTKSIGVFAPVGSLSMTANVVLAPLAYLFSHQLKAQKLPEKPILPAYFILIPITCLYGFSFHRIMVYLQSYFAFDLGWLSFLIMTFSYVCTLSWGIFCLYLLGNYFKNDFLRCDFAPTQWGIV